VKNVTSDEGSNVGGI